MSNQKDKKNQMSSVVTTTEGAREETETSLETLTPREEKVVRMIHGLDEDDSRALQFALGASRDTQVKLAMIEQQLVDCMTPGASQEDADDDRPSPAELLSAWLDQE